MFVDWTRVDSTYTDCCQSAMVSFKGSDGVMTFFFNFAIIFFYSDDFLFKIKGYLLPINFIFINYFVKKSSQ